MKVIIIYLCIINLLSFFVYGIDKYLAIKNFKRIPEKTLFTFSIIAGAFGSILGMIIFHHKTKKKKFWIFNIFCFFITFIIIGFFYNKYRYTYYDSQKFGIDVLKSKIDYDNDGIDDYTDILLGARKDALNKPTYDARYWDTGYPPDNIGVCSDVIWRAFKNAGYNLRQLIDNDIKNNKELYFGVVKRDSNIDFRRVKNLKVFFDRNAKKLTTNIYDIKEWQPGDIVIFGKDYTHIGIISDKRNINGIPWLIHNASQKEREENALEYWSLTSGVYGHYRWEGI